VAKDVDGEAGLDLRHSAACCVTVSCVTVLCVASQLWCISSEILALLLV